MRLYILNITKPYSEDEDGYTGEWFDCPVDFEEVKEKLGFKEVEEIEIADYELPFTLTPSMSLWEINGIFRLIQEIEGTPVGKELQAIVYKWFQNIEDFLNHKDEIRHYYVANPTALAEYLILEEHCFGELLPELTAHIDYASYGRELEQSDRCLFTSSGVFRYQ